MLLRIETTGRYVHHKQAKNGISLHRKEKLKIAKSKSSRLPYVP
jgi:hypothetical protein